MCLEYYHVMRLLGLSVRVLCLSGHMRCALSNCVFVARGLVASVRSCRNGLGIGSDQCCQHTIRNAIEAYFGPGSNSYCR